MYSSRRIQESRERLFGIIKRLWLITGELFNP